MDKIYEKKTPAQLLEIYNTRILPHVISFADTLFSLVDAIKAYKDVLSDKNSTNEQVEKAGVNLSNKYVAFVRFFLELKAALDQIDTTDFKGTPYWGMLSSLGTILVSGKSAQETLRQIVIDIDDKKFRNTGKDGRIQI